MHYCNCQGAPVGPNTIFIGARCPAWLARSSLLLSPLEALKFPYALWMSSLVYSLALRGLSTSSIVRINEQLFGTVMVLQSLVIRFWLEIALLIAGQVTRGLLGRHVSADSKAG